jgi:ribosome-associated protein
MILSGSLREKLLSEIRLAASRSSGPGGQNINKVSTKMELRFHVISSQFLNTQQKNRIQKVLKNRISNTGELVITSQSERTQRGNRQKVIQRFFELMEKALTKPKKRKKTNPTKSSILKRLENKKILSQKKQLRKPPEL